MVFQEKRIRVESARDDRWSSPDPPCFVFCIGKFPIDDHAVFDDGHSSIRCDRRVWLESNSASEPGLDLWFALVRAEESVANEFETIDEAMPGED